MSNIHKLIEHLVNNWSNNLSEALAPRVKQQLMDKFKQEADDFDIKIDDKQLSDYIDYFDARLKNNPKVLEWTYKGSGLKHSSIGRLKKIMIPVLSVNEIYGYVN